MKLVPEVVGTGRAAMAVINPKEGAPWPVSSLFEFGLDDVQDDRDPILVVVSDDTLMGVCRVGGDHAVSLAGVFGRLVGLHKLDD